MELVLRDHQMKVIDALRDGFKNGKRSQLLYAPTGFGKTEVAIYLMKATAANYKRASIVLDRLVLVDQTSDRLSKYGLSHGVYQSGHWKFNPSSSLQVCSAQTLESRGDFPAGDLVIIDECFCSGTKISTPKGSIDIDNVRCGDAVYNQCGIGIVESVSAKPSTEIYKLEFDDGTETYCTGNHPHFTEQGWKATRELEVGAYFFSIEGVRLLWERVEALDQNGGFGENNFSNARTFLEYANYLLSILFEEIEESNEQPSIPFEDEGNSKGDQSQAYKARRKRAIATFATISVASRFGGRVGSGVCGYDEDGQGDGLSELLQVGFGKFSNDDLHRGGWGVTRNIGEKIVGRKENEVFNFPRLVGISSDKRKSPVPVFNLQISGHPSYFANGKLVHNCHIARKQTSEFIRNNKDIKVIGLTATPFTKGLGNLYESVVCGATNNWLVDNRWLTPLRVYIAKEIDMTGAKKVAGEWSQEIATVRGMQITGDIVQEWINKTHEIFGGPRKTIVFCSGVAHGADLVEQFARQGYNFVSISYKDDDELKKQAIEDFAKPDTKITGLIATDILTRGFDVSDVMIGVSARPFSKSFSSHVQQMGRVMRPYEGKDFALWLDHSGNYLRFREDWDDLYAEGVHDLSTKEEKAKKELTENEKKESKCPACGHLWPLGTDTCPACGFVRLRRSVVESVPGRLEELTTNTRGNDKQTFYSELICYARTRSYNLNWASHKFKEKFGAWPTGLSDAPVAVSSKTASWIRHRNIAWAKSRRAA